MRWSTDYSNPLFAPDSAALHSEMRGSSPLHHRNGRSASVIFILHDVVEDSGSILPSLLSSSIHTNRNSSRAPSAGASVITWHQHASDRWSQHIPSSSEPVILNITINRCPSNEQAKLLDHSIVPRTAARSSCSLFVSFGVSTHVSLSHSYPKSKYHSIWHTCLT